MIPCQPLVWVYDLRHSGYLTDEILSRSVQAKTMAEHPDVTLKNAEISG